MKVRIDHKYFSLEKLTQAELLEASKILIAQLQDIKNQIVEARSIYRQTGEGDYNWYQSAIKARKIKGKEHQAILKELQRRKAQCRKLMVMDFPRVFVEVAKTKLPEYIFDEIKKQAMLIIDNEE